MASSNKQLSIDQCLERNREQILKVPGVTAVGIGYKVTGGKATDQLALVICVKEKLPENKLASGAIFPKAIDGQVTDVRQLVLVEPPGYWGDEEPAVEEQVTVDNPATNLRGGDWIGGPKNGATLGFFFKRNGTNELGVTSNAHTFHSQQIFVVASAPSNKPEDRIGEITIRYLPPKNPKNTEEKDLKTGETDGAFVTLYDQYRPSAYKLKDGTSVKGTHTLEHQNIGDAVKYYGAGSEGVVTGVVSLLNVSFLYKSGSSTLKFANQIVLDHSKSVQLVPSESETTVILKQAPGKGGDSGALVVRIADDLAVGVVMSGGVDEQGRPYSVCNPIASFQSDLGITLVTTSLD